jgi:hypothetical protein
MDSKNKTNRLISLFIVGCLLLNFPILSLFNIKGFLMGIPLLYLYIFTAWALLVVFIGLIMRKTPDREKP